jgi:Domain of unknown function (DUF4388)
VRNEEISSMSEVRSVHSVLDVIQNITSNHESGRLEIDACGTPGTFLFNEGKLVHASLGSLKGFPAVNAVVALRDVQFSFDHVTPASHLSTISKTERVVLKRFFGIEVAEMEEAHDTVEPDWNPAPEPVVPLTAVEEIPKTDLEETPTVEVSPVRSPSFVSALQSAYFSWQGVAVGLALLLALAVGAIALRSKLRAQQLASVAAAEEPARSSVSASQPEVKPAVESPSIAISKQPNTRGNDTSGPVVTTVRRESDERAAKTQDLTGEWQVINTVQKTGFKSFDKMQLVFRLKIDQKGKEFTAKGEKFSENGQTLSAVRRTPIHVTGSIEGDKVVATFVEDGRLRKSNGRFVWRLQKSGDALAGTFVSTAANSRGISTVTKQ